MTTPLRILGIDPGLNHTGFGVIDAVGNDLSFVTAGCINVPRGELSERLGFIHRELAKIIEETAPKQAAAEIIYLNINAHTTLLLGQARGAALACASLHELPVMEFTPSEIKLAVAGTGAATKEQIQYMVGKMLHLTGKLQPDAADALAGAITCAHALRVKAIMASGDVLAKTGRRILNTEKRRRNAWELFLKDKQ